MLISILLGHIDDCASFLLQYPVPPNKETEGNTDRIINPWLKTRQRDKVCLSLSISNLKVIEDTV